MKKFIALFFVVVTTLLCFCACQPTEEMFSLAKLDQLAGESYSNVNVKMTVDYADDSQLISIFDCVNNADGSTKVNYAVQQYAQIEVEKDNITLPEEQIETKVGWAKVVNGKVATQSGDDIDVDLSAMGKVNFNFNKLCLANVRLPDEFVLEGEVSYTIHGLEATVVSLKSFMGADIPKATNAKVIVVLTVEQFATVGEDNKPQLVQKQTINQIIVNYDAPDAKVTIVYTLTK